MLWKLRDWWPRIRALAELANVIRVAGEIERVIIAGGF
jgi:hypothetical protein